MKSSVITFPGSNCDRDMDVALKKFGFKNKMVWHADAELPKSDLVVLPGGFSYGDYLRCGSMASKSKIMQSVINFANSGGMVMGICNGFQILVETGLVPGVLLRNKYLEFICRNVFVKINFPASVILCVCHGLQERRDLLFFSLSRSESYKILNFFIMAILAFFILPWKSRQKLLI